MGTSEDDDDAAPQPGPALVGRREQRRLEIRASLVASASALFDEVGYDAAKTSEIAARANVAQATLFRHFETKADLALSHLHDVVDQLVADIIARPRNESPYAAVVAVVGAPGVLDLLTSPEVQAEGARVALHQELAAHIYWMVSAVRERLTSNFAERLAIDPTSSRARLVASIVLECATYTMDASMESDADPSEVFLSALAETRPLLDPSPITSGS